MIDLEDLLKNGENLDLSMVALTPPSSDHNSPMSSPLQSDSSAPNSPSFDDMSGELLHFDENTPGVLRGREID